MNYYSVTRFKWNYVFETRQNVIERRNHVLETRWNALEKRNYVLETRRNVFESRNYVFVTPIKMLQMVFQQ